MVAFGLDLGNARVDPRGLLAVRDGNIILEAFQRLLAGFLVHVGDDILREIQHTVQVATRDVQQLP